MEELFEISEEEYTMIRYAIVSAMQLYDQEIEECRKVLKEYGPNPMTEKTLKYWEDDKAEVESLREKLRKRREKGGK